MQEIPRHTIIIALLFVLSFTAPNHMYRHVRVPGTLLSQSAAEDVAVVLEQKELRVGTSRFLSQPAFVAYKAVLGAYFLFWAVYWPEIDGFSKQAMHQLTFWTWDACAGCENNKFYFCACMVRTYIALPREAILRKCCV